MPRARRWSPEALATLGRMAAAGYADTEIARHLGVPAGAVGRARRARGIAGGLPPRLRIVVARWVLRQRQSVR